MLGGAVVVDEDRAGADVDVVADDRVAEVADVVRLRLAPDPRLLELDEVPDLGARADVRLRSQMAERPQHGAVLDDRVGEHAVGLEHHAVAEAASRHVAAGRDDTLAADRRRAFEDDLGVHHAVGADRDGVLDIGARGVEDRHAGLHELVEDAAALDRGERGKLLTVVDPERLDRVGGRDGLDAPGRPSQDADDIGEIVLTLVVVGLDLRERLPEPLGLEAVDARVDLDDLLLVVRRVAVLDDALDPPALAQDPAVALRSIHDGGEHRRDRARRPVVAHETLERLAREERRVSRQDEDRALAAGRPRLEDRVAGAEALALLDDGDALARHGAHAVCGRPDDDHDPVGEGPRRPQTVREQRPAAERVQHFGLPRAHSLALARCEDDDRQIFHLGVVHSIPQRPA